MNLTESTYFSPEASREYMSFSQWKNWLKCPAMAKAELDGDWQRPDRAALLESSYADVALLTPDELEQWSKDNNEAMKEVKLFNKDGKESAALKKVKASVEVAKKSKWFMSYLEGLHQEIFTFELFGHPWKCKLDVRVPGERIVDLKMMARFQDRVYVKDRVRIPGEDFDEWKFKGFYGAWYEEYNYPGQLAVYREAERQNHGDVLSCLLAAMTKAEEPDARVYRMDDDDRMALELKEIQDVQPLVMQWKTGAREAPRCNASECDYCKTHWREEELVGIDYRFMEKDFD